MRRYKWVGEKGQSGTWTSLGSGNSGECIFILSPNSFSCRKICKVGRCNSLAHWPSVFLIITGKMSNVCVWMGIAVYEVIFSFSLHQNWFQKNHMKLLSKPWKVSKFILLMYVEKKKRELFKNVYFMAKYCLGGWEGELMLCRLRIFGEVKWYFLQFLFLIHSAVHFSQNKLCLYAFQKQFLPSPFFSKTLW